MGDRLHVAHINLSRELRGGEFQTAALGMALAQNEQLDQIRQTIVVRRNSRFHQHLRALLAANDAQPNIALTPVKPTLVATAAAARGADIVHVHEGRSMKVGALASLRNQKFVATRRIQKRPKEIFLTRWIYSRADRITCVSRDVAQTMTRYMGADKISVIYDCARTNASTSGDAMTDPNKPIIVATIGSISFNDKGQDLVLDVARHFQDCAGNIRFVIAGDGTDLEELQELSKALDNVEVLGWVEDVPALLKSSDLLLHPARVEGLGSVLLEAMASGTPVLATKIGGMPEIIEDGRTGFLMDADSAQEIVSKLEQCLKHPEVLKAMGEEAQREAARYSPAAMAEEYIGLYKAVLRSDIAPGE